MPYRRIGESMCPVPYSSLKIWKLRTAAEYWDTERGISNDCLFGAYNNKIRPESLVCDFGSDGRLSAEGVARSRTSDSCHYSDYRCRWFANQRNPAGTRMTLPANETWERNQSVSQLRRIRCAHQ